MAAQPGHTKDLQSVQLERGMRVIDSPGVVFDEDFYDDGKGSKKSSVLLRNVVKVEDVEDPIAVGQYIHPIFLSDSQSSLLFAYCFSRRNSCQDATCDAAEDLQPAGVYVDAGVLDNVGLKQRATSQGTETYNRAYILYKDTIGNFFIQGGTPDLNSAARQVLTDWNQQKIPYFSTPPTIHPSMIPSTGMSTFFRFVHIFAYCANFISPFSAKLPLPVMVKTDQLSLLVLRMSVKRRFCRSYRSLSSWKGCSELRMLVPLAVGETMGTYLWMTKTRRMRYSGMQWRLLKLWKMTGTQFFFFICGNKKE